MSASYPRRTYPHGSLKLAALDPSKWLDYGLSAAQKVAVYWPESANTITLVGYYDTVSAANTAAAAAVSAGAYPRVVINWAHSDFTLVSVGPVLHRDATVSLPAWVDADPAY